MRCVYFYAIIAAIIINSTMATASDKNPDITLRNVPVDVLNKIKDAQHAILKAHPTRTKVGLAEAIYKLIRNSKS